MSIRLFISRKSIGWAGLLSLFIVFSCQPQNDAPTPVVLPAEPAVLWGQMTLKTMTKLPANTPTYGSRALGFLEPQRNGRRKPIFREWAISFVIGGKIYVGLGTNYDGNTKGATYVDFYQYDPATDKWTEKSSFRGSGRDQPVSFVIGNKGYVGTGNTDPFYAATVTADFYEYDPATDKWTTKAPFHA